ncbi:MAG: MBL fold metallo-hydrolase [Clostridia bacterium]|nr:MBL fold metallo-hydrolase [Clostridia bacterium]
MKNILKRVVALIMLFLLMNICSCNNNQTDTSDDKPPKNEPIIPATIDILKIGKADCIVINTGSHLVMIDTGEEENLNTIHAYMSRNNYEAIDTLILTHYDKDHIGGASDVISSFNVSTVIETQNKNTTIDYITYHNTVAEKQATLLKLTDTYKFTYDSCEFEINIPKQSKYSENNDNNLSLIISMKCGENKFLFCGDAMEERISEFINQNKTTYDFVKLPHHGTYLQNYKEFLDSVKPQTVAITDSKKNTASADTLALLYERDITPYETRYGEINISTDGKSIIITQK